VNDASGMESEESDQPTYDENDGNDTTFPLIKTSVTNPLACKGNRELITDDR
jgi:hypothetical protein